MIRCHSEKGITSSPLCTLWLQIRSIVTASPSAAQCAYSGVRAGTVCTPVLSPHEFGLPGSWKTQRASYCCTGYVNEHYEEGECLQPHRTGLWERVPRIFVLHRLTADQAEALSVQHSWSPGGAGHSGAAGSLEVSVSCSRENRALETTDRFTGD